ncbi:hypothetical protein BN1723_019832, partial [Verticillium longisporum]
MSAERNARPPTSSGLRHISAACCAPTRMRTTEAERRFARLWVCAASTPSQTRRRNTGSSMLPSSSSSEVGSWAPIRSFKYPTASRTTSRRAFSSTSRPPVAMHRASTCLRSCAPKTSRSP